jgi:hypothetical protein
MKNLLTTKNLILLSSILCIFWAEWIYLVQQDQLKAIFVGLWSPTILCLLNYFKQKN